MRAISVMLLRFDFKKSWPVYITVGLFDQDEAIQRMFESSVKAVNQDRHKNEEFSNVYLLPKAEEIETDSYEAWLKGEAACEC